MRTFKNTCQLVYNYLGIYLNLHFFVYFILCSSKFNIKLFKSFENLSFKNKSYFVNLRSIKIYTHNIIFGFVGFTIVTPSNIIHILAYKYTWSFIAITIYLFI